MKIRLHEPSRDELYPKLTLNSVIVEVLQGVLIASTRSICRLSAINQSMLSRYKTRIHYSPHMWFGVFDIDNETMYAV